MFFPTKRTIRSSVSMECPARRGPNPERKTTALDSCWGAQSLLPFWLEPPQGITRKQALVSRSGGSNLVQNRHCAADFGDAKKHQRNIRPCFDPAVRVVDVDVSIAESRCGARQLARSVRQFGLSDFRHGVAQALSVQDRLGRRRVVHYEAN